MTAHVTFAVQAFDRFPQELVITAVGADVPLFAFNRPAGESDAEDAIPDPVELFAIAVNQQMFPGPGEEGCTSGARIIERKADLARSLQSWRLRIESAHPACLRVLSNLLAARDFQSVEVQAAGGSPGAAGLAGAHGGFASRSPGYPPLRSGLSFFVEREEAIRSLRDRFITVELAQPPSDETFEIVSAALEIWCSLLLLGAYPAEEMEPRESGVLPDGPLLLDPVTIQLAFPEVFHADDAAFDPILNHLHCLSQEGVAIRLVRIR